MYKDRVENDRNFFEIANEEIQQEIRGNFIKYVLFWIFPCPYQLGNKFPKETILNIWRNEKYFFRFAYLSAIWLQFGENSIDIITENNFALDFALIVTKQLIDI